MRKMVGGLEGWIYGDVFVVVVALRRGCGMRLVLRDFYGWFVLPEAVRMGPEVADVLRLVSQMVESVMESLRGRRDVLGLERWIFLGNCGWRKGVLAVNLGSRLGEFARSQIEFVGG